MKTCAGCRLVRGSEVLPGFTYAHCSARPGNPFVPQRTRSRERTITFWRVPLECPIHTGSAERVAPQNQTTISYDDLEMMP
jgi:hypothetical protein